MVIMKVKKMKRKTMNRAFGIRFAVIVLCVVSTTLSVVFSVIKIRETKEYVAQMRGAIDTLSTAEIGHLKWSSNLNATIEYGAEFTGSTSEKECVLGKHIYSEVVQNDPKLKETVGEIEPLHKDIHRLAASALEAIAINQSQAKLIYQQDIQPEIDSLLVLLDDAIKGRQGFVATAENELDNIIDMAIFIAISLMAITLIACLNMYVYIKHQIGKPIMLIAKNAKKLAEGKLDLDFKTNSKNEVGELGQLLNSSVKTIATYIIDIDRAMEEFSVGNFNVIPSQSFIGDFKNIETSIGKFIINMSSTLQTITQSSDQVSSSAAQISDGSQALAQGATKQASGVQELSATITELSDQVQHTAHNFKEIDQIMSVTCGQVREGSLKMEDMTHAMDEIIVFSQKINNIIKTIDDITFQTNILALNAAVEAARAGTAGKGFAVVADEVRNLAQKSANAAKDIAALIESSIMIVNNGATLTRDSSAVFRNIVDMSNEITEMVGVASDAAEKQASAIIEIVQGIDQISSVVQTNSATSEESAAASEELHSQVQLLKEMVSKFTLMEEM